MGSYAQCYTGATHCLQYLRNIVEGFTGKGKGKGRKGRGREGKGRERYDGVSLEGKGMRRERYEGVSLEGKGRKRYEGVMFGW